jgi:hypothetical protein
MNDVVYDAGFVSTTILQLHGEIAKITGVANRHPTLRLIGVAIVLARALESIFMLVLADKTSSPSHQDDEFRASTFAAAVRDELVDAIADLDRDDDQVTVVDPPFIAVLMERAISAIDLLVGDRAVIELNVEDDAERAAQILSLTISVVGSAGNAVNWLCAPSIHFDGQRPFDLLTSRQGVNMVTIHLRAKLSGGSANA